MQYERFDESRGMRLLRALSKTFRVGRFFGVEVRMFWIALILMPLIVWPSYLRAGYPAGEGLLMSALFAAGLFLITYSHEMGHIAAGWRYNIRTPLITLSPMGGLAHMDAPAPSPKAAIFVAAAGPATHLVWLAVLWPLSQMDALQWGAFRPDGWAGDPVVGTLLMLRDMNLALLLFNLLPFFPMDGGRILRSILAFRMHPNRASIIAARVGMVGAVAIAIYGLFWTGYWGGILLVIGISNFLECRREIKRARWAESPYGERREAWEEDGDAWKHGGAAPGGRPSTRTVGPTRADRKAEQRAVRERLQSQADADELDALLARVSKVGLPGLSKKERAALQRLSKRSS